MSLQIRRVVTGHTDDGRAKVEVDEIATNVVSNRPGASSCVVWSTKGFPVDNDGFTDPTKTAFKTTVENGTVFRVVSYQPGVSPRNQVISSCSIVSANQVRYHWKTISPVGLEETLVEMHLRPNPGACILGLKHSGFKDAAESAWFDRMWRQSLDRLCGLISKSHSVASH